MHVERVLNDCYLRYHKKYGIVVYTRRLDVETNTLLSKILDRLFGSLKKGA